MRSNRKPLLKVVTLLNSAMCQSCRFGSYAAVEMQDGSSRQMVHCARGDCDNWRTDEARDRPTRIIDHLEGKNP